MDPGGLREVALTPPPTLVASRDRWQELGGDRGAIEIAQERAELIIGEPGQRPPRANGPAKTVLGEAPSVITP